MSHPDLDARAREVIDTNYYLVLGTTDPSGLPRLSPVFFSPHAYTDFYWVSSPDSHHSANIAERDEVSIVIFDSTAAVGAGKAIYITATARAIEGDELDERCKVAFRPVPGSRPFAPSELSGSADLRLYVASANAYDVHVRGSDPVHGTGIDRRLAADPRLSG